MTVRLVDAVPPVAVMCHDLTWSDLAIGFGITIAGTVIMLVGIGLFIRWLSKP